MVQLGFAYAGGGVSRMQRIGSLDLRKLAVACASLGARHDPQAALVIRKGHEHEAACLRRAEGAVRRLCRDPLRPAEARFAATSTRWSAVSP